MTYGNAEDAENAQKILEPSLLVLCNLCVSKEVLKGLHRMGSSGGRALRMFPLVGPSTASMYSSICSEVSK